MIKNLIVITCGIMLMSIMSLNYVYAQENNTNVNLLDYTLQKDKIPNEFSGQIENSLDGIASFVEINATFYDENQKVLGNNITYTDPQDIFPKMKALFEMTINDVAGDIKSYDVVITWNGPGSGINIIQGLQ